MPIVVRLLHRPAHRYQRHKQRGPCLQQLRSRNIFHQRQRIFLHRVDQLRSGPEDSRQRHKQHRPYLRSMPDWAIFYRTQPERLHRTSFYPLEPYESYHHRGSTHPLLWPPLCECDHYHTNKWPRLDTHCMAQRFLDICYIPSRHRKSTRGGDCDCRHCSRYRRDTIFLRAA